MKGPKNAIRTLAAWWSRSVPGRLQKRYSERNAKIFASGLAYGLLFAFFAGVWSVISVFGVIFSNNANFRESFLSTLNVLVPGLAGGEDAVLSADTLASASTTFTLTGVVTLVVFWWQITNWFGSLRSCVQTLVDPQREEANSDSSDTRRPQSEAVVPVTNPFKARLLDTGAVFVVAFLFILTTLMGSASGGIVAALWDLFGTRVSSTFTNFLIGLIGFVAALLLNFLLLVVLFRFVCQIRRLRQVMWVSFVGAALMSIIQLLGGRLLTGASSNPLLAPFAAVVAVLIWFNIIAQVLMFCAAALGEFIDRAEEK